MPYFILGLGLFVGLIFLSHWYSKANPAIVIKTLKIIVLVTGLLIALFLIFTGRIFLVLAALPLLIPFLLRSRALLQRLKAAAGGTPGKTSQVVTKFLRMVLLHDSGEMDGEVLSGAQEGRRLSELSLVDIEQLYRVYVIEENKSADLLSAYAERRFGSEWQCGEGANQRGQADREGSSFSNASLDRKNALEILGLDEAATEDDIREAHKNLMQKLHPDHGGNNYLATQINRAKDVLLKGAG
ncbi:MAG: DnaJ domain-containing protein [Halopseudomonas aestusnigri]